MEFTDRNIAADTAAMDELTRLGHMTTPVIVIDGVIDGEVEVVVGFDRARLEALLG